MTVYVLPHQAARPGIASYDVTSRGGAWAQLNPMRLGPVMLYAGMWSRTVENAWQYAKVYPQYADASGNPAFAYWQWAAAGWADPRGVRYPAGKGAVPLYSLWAGERLGYTDARRRIYLPLYAQAVRMYALPALAALRAAAAAGDLALLDFDAYDHRALGYAWADVLADPSRKMGHGFVLAMMLDGAA